MKKAVFILFMFISIFTCAQDEMVSLKAGKMDIGVYYGEEFIHISNTDARVLLNFETNEISIKISPKSFIIGIDTIKDFVTHNLFDPIIFEGIMNLNYYSPEKNRVEKFGVEGDIIVEGEKKHILMDGVLVSDLPNGANTFGRIELHFDIKANELGLPPIFNPFNGYACIEISQALLNTNR